jgi:hypothetical protein
MNLQSAKLPTLSHQAFSKKVIEGSVGNVRNKMARKKRTTKLEHAEERPDGKLHLIKHKLGR